MSNQRKIIYITATVVAAIGLILLLNIQNQQEPASNTTADSIIAAESEAASDAASPVQAAPVESFKPGDRVDFTLKTNKGEISSKDFLGKPLMLEFIATWCPYCQQTTPNIKTALGKVPTPFIMIGAADESEEAVIEFHKSYGLPGPVGFDPGLALIRRFGGSGYPTLVYIDSEGRLVSSSSGEAGVSEIVSNLDRAKG